MQGRKTYQPQLFYQVILDDLVPHDNFYRRLSAALDLQFIYKATAHYYGIEGQESIDPVVFYKILLVGYLNNINSDRALLRFCGDSLGVRLYLGHTHYSPTDPDAKISVKPGKARQGTATQLCRTTCRR